MTRIHLEEDDKWYQDGLSWSCLSFHALPRTLMQVFSFSLRVGGRPCWAQKQKYRAAHSHWPDFCCMSSAWSTCCMSCHVPNCGETCVSQDSLMTSLATSSERTLSAFIEVEVRPWPKNALLTSFWNLCPVRSVLPAPCMAGVCLPSLFKTRWLCCLGID